MVGRLLAFSSVGVAGGAAAATAIHAATVLMNTADNGWAHTSLRQAENCRMHGGIVSLATRPPFFARAMELAAQVVLAFQLLFVYTFFPSVGHAYTGYRAEEQVRTVTQMLDMIDRGKAPWLAGLRAPALAKSYYGLPRGRRCGRRCCASARTKRATSTSATYSVS